MSIEQNDSRPAENARILIVDDNQYGLRARKTILEQLGHSIIAINCPCAALNCFSAEPFDLVITDYRMPNMSGAGLITRLREARPGIPVILISGFVDTLGLDEATTGANAVIQKGAHEVPQMIREVDRLLGRTKPARKPPTPRAGRPPGGLLSGVAR